MKDYLYPFLVGLLMMFAALLPASNPTFATRALDAGFLVLGIGLVAGCILVAVCKTSR